VIHALEQGSVPYFLDPIGNLIIGASSKKDYLAIVQRTTKEPLRVMIAHMDHPGFHGIYWKSPTTLQVQWHGGSPTQHLENARVWLSHTAGESFCGVLKHVKLLSSGHAIDTAWVEVEPAGPGGGDTLAAVKAQQIFGGFRFKKPVWTANHQIYAHAADDLIGVFAILSLALDTWGQGRQKTRPFLGLLTRAEEVGFIGAIGHFELGWLRQPKRPLLCVSLETSRALPGAEIGLGPVVRLGDRYTVFDPGALRVFSDLAQKVLPGKHQRRMMDGGTCEATAASVFGFPAIGISVPLGNYHNQSLEGGADAAPRNGPAPEFVHLNDVAGLLTLCHALLETGLPWTQPWNKKRTEFKKALTHYQSLLLNRADRANSATRSAKAREKTP
jgi:endoglucanase